MITIVITISEREFPAIDIRNEGVVEQYAEFRGVNLQFWGLAGRLEPDSLHFSSLEAGRAPSSRPRNALWHPLRCFRIRELADGDPRDSKLRPSSPPLGHRKPRFLTLVRACATSFATTPTDGHKISVFKD